MAASIRGDADDPQRRAIPSAPLRAKSATSIRIGGNCWRTICLGARVRLTDWRCGDAEITLHDLDEGDDLHNVVLVRLRTLADAGAPRWRIRP
jgi:hypothetical protein